MKASFRRYLFWRIVRRVVIILTAPLWMPAVFILILISALWEGIEDELNHARVRYNLQEDHHDHE